MYATPRLTRRPLPLCILTLALVAGNPPDQTSEAGEAPRAKRWKYDVDVLFGEAGFEKALGHGLRRLGVVTGRVGGVDLDELFEDLAGQRLLRRQRRLRDERGGDHEHSQKGSHDNDGSIRKLGHGSRSPR